MYLRESHQRGRSRWHIHLMHFGRPHGQLAMPGTHSETRPCASRGIELGSKTRFVLIGSFDGPEKRGEAPKKCSTFPERSRHVLWDLWSTLIVTPDFSSDLERAPGARSIAEEKSGVTILVIELHWSQGSEHFRSPAVFLGILPRYETVNPPTRFGFVAKSVG